MIKDFVQETASNPGSNARFPLAGAVANRRSFAQAFGTGVQAFAFMDNGSQWQACRVLTEAGTPDYLTIQEVYSNSAGTTDRLNFSGTVNVYNEVPAARVPYLDLTQKLSLAWIPDSISWIKLSAQTLTAVAASVTFTLSTGYSRYELTYQNIRAASNPANGFRVALNYPGSPTPGATEYESIRDISDGRVRETTTSGQIGGIVSPNATADCMEGVLWIDQMGGFDRYTQIRATSRYVDYNSGSKRWEEARTAIICGRAARPDSISLFFASSVNIQNGEFVLYGQR
ncbi:hypothetical protein MHL39_10830 [Roseomonas mucosa]|uniref:hypothetical protein n=1 Tax=Roseomonas mucosa TaxID=207340 RepID=UPI001EF5B203|nr:hypothetical protein [Roseomonas mucosa]MCG7357133.1 hypothetical protein [Roseomonas mucosa]